MHGRRIRTGSRTRTVWAGGLALAALALAAPATAEGFFDIYLGAGIPENGDVDTRANSVGFSLSESPRVDYETTPSLGLRGGYWFEGAANFIGVGLDLSYYRLRGDAFYTSPAVNGDRDVDVDFYAFPFTPLLMVRIPIDPSEDFPGGRVQPYGAIGPGFTTSVAVADFTDSFASGGFLIVDDEFVDSSFDVGLDARAGLAIHLAKPIALFTEYRYTRLRPEYDEEVDAFGPDFDFDLEPDLDVHHITFGVSFRF